MARNFVRASNQIVNWGGNPSAALSLWLVAWIKPTSTSLANQTAIVMGDGPGGYYAIFTEPNGVVRAQLDPSGHSSATIATSGNNALTAGVWQHVAAFFSNGGGGQNFQIFVNGVKQGQANYTGNIPASVSDLSVGGDGFSGNNYFDGQIAEAAIYNGLDFPFLATLVAGVPPSRVEPKNLIWYLPLYGVSSPEPDLSGYGRNGVVTGATFANHAPVGRYVSAAKDWSSLVSGLVAPSSVIPQRTLRGVGI